MRFASLDEWLAWQEKCHSREIDLGLERVRKVAQRLDLLRPRAKIITVAGTNGKGSCVAALEYLLQAQGYSTGAYSSPHLLDYNERIRLKGAPATDSDICRAFDAIDKARGAISLSYFEFGTLAAFWLFREFAVEYWLLEVGLGGRLDATNIVDPDVAVITSIDLDHQQWLGSNRESIGREKAGIFRPGRPAVCADLQTPDSVRAHAQQVGSHLLVANHDFSWRDLPQGRWQLTLARGDSPLQIDLPQPRLPQPSIAAALQTLALLNVLPGTSGLTAALPQIRLAGRFQRCPFAGGSVILDVAHNPAAARYLAARLRGEGLGQLSAVVAMMADKDIEGSLTPLMPFIDRWYLAGLPDVPRAAAPELIEQVLQRRGVADSVLARYPDVATAIEQWVARPKAQLDTVGSDTLLVLGSFYTVAAAMQIVVRDPDQHATEHLR